MMASMEFDSLEYQDYAPLRLLLTAATGIIVQVLSTAKVTISIHFVQTPITAQGIPLRLTAISSILVHKIISILGMSKKSIIDPRPALVCSPRSQPSISPLIHGHMRFFIDDMPQRSSYTPVGSSFSSYHTPVEQFRRASKPKERDEPSRLVQGMRLLPTSNLRMCPFSQIYR